MQDQVNATPTPLKRVPWNKGKVTLGIEVDDALAISGTS